MLFRDDFVGVVRVGHPLLTEPITPARYGAFGHVVASRKGAFAGPVDAALKTLGLGRMVVAVVPGFRDAIRIASRSDLVALVPRACLAPDPANGGTPSGGVVDFDLPVPTPAIAISAMWHPRMDADPAHRWLRSVVMTVCRPSE